jgi:hypothetical protein
MRRALFFLQIGLDLLLPMALVVGVQAAHAQTCFPGRPLPSCRSFPVTEIGYAHRLDKTPLRTGGEPQVHYLNGEVGWMFNRSPRLALGGTFFAGALVDYAFEFRPGLKARARYWISPHTGLDLGAGVILGRVPAGPSIFSPEERRLGGNAHVGLSYRDAALLLAQLEYLPNPIDRDWTSYLGARLGSKPAAWTALIVGPLLALGALAFSN